MCRSRSLFLARIRSRSLKKMLRLHSPAKHYLLLKKQWVPKITVFFIGLCHSHTAGINGFECEALKGDFEQSCDLRLPPSQSLRHRPGLGQEHLSCKFFPKEFYCAPGGTRSIAKITVRACSILSSRRNRSATQLTSHTA